MSDGRPFRSEDEEREYWAEHDSTEHVDWSRAERVSVPDLEPSVLREPESQARLTKALSFAVEQHAGQPRKGTRIPYASHLLQVAGLVLEHGGSADQAVAGLLHDVVEDQGVEPSELKRLFGEEVARIVRGCTDTEPGDTPEQKAPWPDRKRRYLAHLREADDAVLLVSACDKLDNLRSILADLHAEGLPTLHRLGALPDQTVWYYAGVLEAVRGRVPKRLERELGALTRELRSFVEGAGPPGA